MLGRAGGWGEDGQLTTSLRRGSGVAAHQTPSRTKTIRRPAGRRPRRAGRQQGSLTGGHGEEGTKSGRAAMTRIPRTTPEAIPTAPSDGTRSWRPRCPRARYADDGLPAMAMASSAKASSSTGRAGSGGPRCRRRQPGRDSGRDHQYGRRDRVRTSRALRLVRRPDAGGVGPQGGAMGRAARTTTIR